MANEIVIVDTGGANLASLVYAFERLGANPKVSTDPHRIRNAAAAVLPGVGAAGDAMQRLDELGLTETIKQLSQPVLGICLGMHLLGTTSEEQQTRCLSIVDDSVEKLVAVAGRPVPHMGWNAIRASGPHPLLTGLPDEAWFYFVHSFAMRPSSATIAEYQYGASYSAILGERNFYATQFHPERSGHNGQQLLRNFLELT